MRIRNAVRMRFFGGAQTYGKYSVFLIQIFPVNLNHGVNGTVTLISRWNIRKKSK